MRLGNVMCLSCGLYGVSKCPMCRSIFDERPETPEQETCSHTWDYSRMGDKCIYSCGHVRTAPGLTQAVGDSGGNVFSHPRPKVGTS